MRLGIGDQPQVRLSLLDDPVDHVAGLIVEVQRHLGILADVPLQVSGQLVEADAVDRGQADAADHLVLPLQQQGFDLFRLAQDVPRVVE